MVTFGYRAYTTQNDFATLEEELYSRWISRRYQKRGGRSIAGIWKQNNEEKIPLFFPRVTSV